MLRKLRLKVRSLIRRDDFSREIEGHIEELTREGLALGLTPRAARLAALRQFGNTANLEERSRELLSFGRLEDLWGEARHAGRALRRAPGSTLAIVILLTLGMGGVTALFGPLYSLVLKPLPFPHSERLVQSKFGPGLVDPYAEKDTVFKNPEALERVFSSVMAYDLGPNTLSGDGPAVSVPVAVVSSGFFATLGVQPRLGMADRSGVVVSDEFWRERLHGARDLSACAIALGGTRFRVTGVMPAGFDFPSGAQIWQPAWPLRNVVGRLRPEISIQQAQAYLRSTLSKDYAKSGAGDLESLHDAVMGSRKPLLWILSAVSVLFLALACAGAANLLLARGVRRRKEMVLRSVLGASRGRLVRQLLMETLLLAAFAASCVLAFLALANRELRVLLPPGLEKGAAFSPASIAIAACLTLAVTLLCGMAPALHATGADLNDSLKAGHPGLSRSGRGRRSFTAHECYTGGQLVLAMILLGSTGLLLHSLYARLNFPLGFQPRGLAVVTIGIPQLPELREAGSRMVELQRRFPSWRDHVKLIAEQDKILGPARAAQGARNQSFYREAMQRLAGLPEVESLAATYNPPLLGGAMRGVLLDPDLPGDFIPLNTTGTPAFVSYFSPETFRVLNIPFLAGRNFREEDIPSDAWKHRPEVAIVSEMAAKRLWPNQDPIGKFVRTGATGRLRVIGVVANIHESRDSLLELPKVYTLFVAGTGNRYSFLVRLRAGASYSRFAAAVRGGLLPLPSDAAPPTVASLEASDGDLPLFLGLLSCFAALGLVVAGLGVYATGTVMAAAQTREMGIRLAVGGSAEQIGGLVLWRSARLALLALPVGALGSWGLGIYLKHWLFQVGAADPLSYASSAVVLLVIALAAGLWPAMRAARTDPLAALRFDG